jgi:hypothetical protein
MTTSSARGTTGMAATTPIPSSGTTGARNRAAGDQPPVQPCTLVIGRTIVSR